MKKFAIVLTAAVVSFSTVSAYAGGFGSRGNGNNSGGGLINISPGIALGDIGILNGSPILSGNNTQVGGILNGVGVGILGVGTGLSKVTNSILGGGNTYKLGKH